MNISQFFRKAIKIGIEHDPRGRKKLLTKFKGKNPYPDSQILHPGSLREIKNLLIGIDIGAAELLLADKIRGEQGIDLVVAHHPAGKALAELVSVMRVQLHMLQQIGVPKEIASGMLQERMQEVNRKVLATNHMRSVDIARLLNIPFVCLHTVADNMAYYFVKNLMQRKKPTCLGDILKILEGIPEYSLAKKETVGPRILLGSLRRSPGKVFVEMTGGTEGPRGVIPKLYKAGVRTLISMHLSEEHFKQVKDTNLNVIIAGHISSDSLGLNLLLDRIDQDNAFKVVSCSGFRRISRK